MKSGQSTDYLKFFEIILVGAFILAGFLLFWQEKVNHDPDFDKSWLNFYFKNPDRPNEGVELNNHLGYELEFRLCLVPDNNNLMEPKDLSCNLDTVLAAKEIKIAPTEKADWKWLEPSQDGKYWIILQYITKEGQENKRSLSFEK